MNKETKFLTQEHLDKPKLLKVLKDKYKFIEDSDDKKILKNIINNFDNKDFSLLFPQEIKFLNNHSSDIWDKYLIFRYRLHIFPEKQIVYDFPIYLLIEPVSACNLRCVMCFQIDDSFSSSKNFMGKMEFSLFKKIIDDAYNGGTKAITMASRGEPTLHPQLGEMLEYCKGKFFELKMNTNGTLLTDKLIHQILQSGVTEMVFSVDSYSKKEYESIRVKGIFETVLNNIKKFKEIREKFYPNSSCATRVSGVKINDTQDPKMFRKFWQNYVDNVVMVEMQYKWDTYSNPKENMSNGPCDILWERMYIWYDGICNPCDIDYKSELAVGSIKENNIYDIWHGGKYTQYRSAHKNGNRQMLYPCDRCSVGS
jgi:organic radical activating enzyme|tara:strand:- start:1217 stop:2320 length:1104 start_codon:yes stop_codon:yes gene_type:complete